jgi:hypothetical protein
MRGLTKGMCSVWADSMQLQPQSAAAVLQGSYSRRRQLSGGGLTSLSREASVTA